ncbi:MAG TPA: hypothetical protein VGG64_17345 [Pirellulales bacterium]|jgi:hypothetical protein
MDARRWQPVIVLLSLGAHGMPKLDWFDRWHLELKRSGLSDKQASQHMGTALRRKKTRPPGPLRGGLGGRSK